MQLQTKIFLQTLLTHISAGYSLENALCFISPNLKKTYGSKASMIKPLKKLEQRLSSGQDLSIVLYDFCVQLDYLELLPIVRALTLVRKIGNGIEVLIENCCHMVSESIALRQEVDANNAGKYAEATILCIMPFGLTSLLSSFTGSYMQTAKSSITGNALLFLAFTIAVFSCALLLRGLSENKPHNSLLSNPNKGLCRIGFLGEIMTKIVPRSVQIKHEEIFQEIRPTFGKELRHYWTKLMLITILIAFICVISSTSLNIYAFLILLAIPMIFLLSYLNLRAQAQKRRDVITEELPVFLSMLCALLHSGILLNQSLEICSRTYKAQSLLGREFTYMKLQMQGGKSAINVLENFAARTPIPEFQSAILLSTRYEKSGVSEVLQLLSLQTSACWSLCRNNIRRKKEKDSLTILGPMMLDLVAVLIVAAAPAFLTLKGTV